MPGRLAKSIDRIVLSHVFDVLQWLPVAYIDLCQFQETFTSAGIKQLGEDNILLILAVCEDLLRAGHVATKQDIACRVDDKLGISPLLVAALSSHTSLSLDNATVNESTMSATQTRNRLVEADFQLNFIERLIEDLNIESL
jgi:hypothetical protein